MPRFEGRVRDWRSRLEAARGAPDLIQEIRREIVAVRRGLREEGWELRLGSLDVVVKGSRSDDAIARGFTRMVLVFAEDGVIYHAKGQANHEELDRQLHERLAAQKIHGNMDPHYVWYRLLEGVVELAGADSEPASQFERLKTIVAERKSDLVRAFRGLS
jgi:hypothetical protein